MAVVQFDPKRFQSTTANDTADMFDMFGKALQGGMQSARYAQEQDTSTAVESAFDTAMKNELAKYGDHENINPNEVRANVASTVREQMGHMPYYQGASDKYVTDDLITQAIGDEEVFRGQQLDSYLAGQDIDWTGDNIPMEYAGYQNMLAEKIAADKGISLSEANKIVQQSPMFSQARFEQKLRPWQQEKAAQFQLQVNDFAKKYGPEYTQKMIEAGLFGKPWQNLGPFGNILFPTVEGGYTHEPTNVWNIAGNQEGQGQYSGQGFVPNVADEGIDWLQSAFTGLDRDQRNWKIADNQNLEENQLPGTLGVINID
tara:strand:- start:1011 stop:1955 length:945 start_codon:yes stop_codon:yes gene_type:complete